MQVFYMFTRVRAARSMRARAPAPPVLVGTLFGHPRCTTLPFSKYTNQLNPDSLVMFSNFEVQTVART